jgi:hypothetical protein
MDGLPAWMEVATGLFVFLVGGGTIGPWLTKRLRAGQQAETEAVLRQKFATLDELNGIGRKLGAYETMWVQHNDRLDDLQDRTLKLETISEQRWERVTEQMQEVARTLNVVMKQVRSVSDAQIRISALIEKGNRP